MLGNELDVAGDMFARGYGAQIGWRSRGRGSRLEGERRETAIREPESLCSGRRGIHAAKWVECQYTVDE